MTFLALLSACGTSFAQKEKPKNVSWYDDKTLHFGFCIGFNVMDFNITPSQQYLQSDSLYPEVALLNPGINIQIVTDFRPAEHFDIRFLPGVAFGQRNVRFYKNRVLENEQQRLESSFLEFPLLLKYKGERLNNVRPYIIGGINYRYDLAGKKEYDDEKPVYLRIRRSDLYYEIGPGLDFYLPYFKLSVELKMSTGMRDVLVHEPAPGYPQYARAIERMKSQIWVLSFHFE
ncbi:MAG TPA: porin family protein [Bacteroidales bacterium]|nr:porin family protein [Bacteroidales bacterium]HRR94088.1 porin family protein [Bacteroidales bacterium]HRT90464.1 porin family protein [Bacteroidales bacterium]